MAEPKQVFELAGREVAISNPSKVFFARAGVTKLDMVRYYLSVASGALGGVAAMQVSGPPPRTGLLGGSSRRARSRFRAGPGRHGQTPRPITVAIRWPGSSPRSIRCPMPP